MTDAPRPPRTGVVVIGSVSADVTTFSARLPAPGETVLGDDVTLVLGGKGANQAVAAGLAGARTSFVGCVGDDPFRDLVVSGLQDAGVDLTHLRTVPGPTGIAQIRVDASAQNDIVVVPMANTRLSVDQIDAALVALSSTASVLLTQLETPRTLTARIAARGRALGYTVILDPAPAATLPAAMWADIDIVTPNETEASALTGVEVTDPASAAQAGRWFVAHGVGAAVITLAAQGSVIVTADCTDVIPPMVVDAVDTTAAGDAYAGYLAAELAAGSDLGDAARVATAAGALAVTVRGASPSLPPRRAVDAFLRRIG